MHYLARRRCQIALASISFAFGLTGLATAGPLPSESRSVSSYAIGMEGAPPDLLSMTSPTLRMPDTAAYMLSASMQNPTQATSAPIGTGWDWATNYDFTNLSAGSPGSPVTPWLAFKTADPTMRLTDWNRVFNVARLGLFTLPARSDPAEQTNILLSAEAVDNVTLQPGQVFSFNHVVGERSPSRGYQDGWMYDNGHLVRGTGGGICLVATGLYNIALRAGLGLIERHHHSGLVRYAEPGCDAAVAYGSEDMKFENTTSSPLYIRTIRRQDRVSLALFGSRPPAGSRIVVKPTHFAWIPAPVVQKPDPTLPAGQTVVEQKPRLGYSVVVERDFYQRNRLLRKEVVAKDTLKPLAKVVRVPSNLPSQNMIDSFFEKIYESMTT